MMFQIFANLTTPPVLRSRVHELMEFFQRQAGNSILMVIAKSALINVLGLRILSVGYRNQS